MSRIIIPEDVIARQMMTHPTTNLSFQLSMQRGEVREAMGWSYIARMERLRDELLSKSDCPDTFWIVYSAKWSKSERRIKELWQVDDKKPTVHMIGQIIVEVDKRGTMKYWALPADVPVPDSEYSDEMVTEHSSDEPGYLKSKNVPLSKQQFVSL